MTLPELRQRLDASAGRIAKAPPHEQPIVLAREVSQFEGETREFAISELGLLARKLELERQAPPPIMSKGYYLNLLLAVVFVLIIFCISAIVKGWTGSFISAVAVSSGTLLLIALLPMVMSSRSLSAFQRETLRMYLALAAAGVGAGIPGFLQLSVTSAQWSLSAGGALALFVLVYWKSPSWLAPKDH